MDVDVLLAMTGLGNEMLVREGADPARIVVKPNFVEGPDRVSDIVERGVGEMTFVFLGRLVPEKGITTVIDASSRLEDADGVRIVVAGDGPLRSVVEEAATKVGPRLQYAGHLDRKSVVSLIDISDGLIFPSLWYEAGPTMAMLESFSMGRPVLAADTGNFTDAIVEGVSGRVFKAGDPVSLVAALRQIAKDRTAWREMGSSSRVLWEERYSPEAVLPQLEASYVLAVSNHLERKAGKSRRGAH